MQVPVHFVPTSDVSCELINTEKIWASGPHIHAQAALAAKKLAYPTNDRMLLVAWQCRIDAPATAMSRARAHRFRTGFVQIWDSVWRPTAAATSLSSSSY
jgi:hypothetical protein